MSCPLRAVDVTGDDGASSSLMMRRRPARLHADGPRTCARSCKRAASRFARLGRVTATVDIRVLGNVEVRRGAEVVAIGGPKPRQILAMLVAARGGVVPTDLLHEELWGDDQPADPAAVLQSNISRLRKLLHPDARIVARPPGYALEIDPLGVDAWRFEAHYAAARAAADPGRVDRVVPARAGLLHRPAVRRVLRSRMGAGRCAAARRDAYRRQGGAAVGSPRARRGPDRRR